MTTLREFKAKLDAFVAAHPEALDLTALSVDDQCAHTDVSTPLIEEVEGWPTEYCIEEALPNGATHFVRF